MTLLTRDEILPCHGVILASQHPIEVNVSEPIRMSRIFKNNYIKKKQQHTPLFFKGKSLLTCLERTTISVIERKR